MDFIVLLVGKEIMKKMMDKKKDLCLMGIKILERERKFSAHINYKAPFGVVFGFVF